MGEKKVFEMILEVNLHCDCCYKRVKKVLCKFPEIRDQKFDEKSNTVTIKVLCCDPENIRYKLCNKARGSIKSIEINEPQPPTPPESPEIKPPKPTCCAQCRGGRTGGPCNYGYGPIPSGYYYVYGPLNRHCHPCWCFSEENPAGCSVM